MLRLFGYIRVSAIGGREGEGYISPDVQREASDGYAAELGGSIVAWFEDQDYTGGNMDRPDFQRMLGLLEAGEGDGFVVMKVDRFARNTADGLLVVKGILARKQVFASAHERIDPRTKEGRYMLRQFLSNGEYFLDQIKESWQVAKAKAIAAGKHIGPTPVGYLKVEAVPTKPTHISPVDSAALGGPTSPGVLVPHPTYGTAIATLFEHAGRGGRGDTELARWMTERAPRETGGPWNPSEVRRWLKNRVYLGEVRYGELVNEEAHMPLVGRKTWARCQRPEAERYRASSPFLLAGLIRCAGCRYAMGGQSGGGTDGTTPVYRCPRSNRGCPAPSVITAARVEGYVVDLIRRRQIRFREAGKLDRGQEMILSEAREADEEVAAFAADLMARKTLGESGWHDALRLRVSDRDAKRQRAREVEAELQGVELAREVDVDDLDRHGLRDLLVGLVGHIFVRRRRGAPAADRALVVWKAEEGSVDVPGPHRSGPFETIDW